MRNHCRTSRWRGALHETLGSLAAPPFYAAMQAFDSRMAEVESALERLQTMRTDIFFLGKSCAVWKSFCNFAARNIKTLKIWKQQRRKENPQEGAKTDG